MAGHVTRPPLSRLSVHPQPLANLQGCFVVHIKISVANAEGYNLPRVLDANPLSPHKRRSVVQFNRG